MSTDPTSPAPTTRLGAIVRGRCPACRRGPIFASAWVMHERCPVCGLLLLRAPGYFTGAMYFSYGLGIPCILGLTGLWTWLRPGWPLWQRIGLAWVLFLPLVPTIFRLSRVLWIHLDRAIDPAGDDFPRPPEPGPGAGRS